MSFSDLEFAAFLPLAWILFWLLPRRVRWQNAGLLLLSYVFYASWDVRLLALLVSTTLVDFALIHFIDRHRPPPRAERSPATTAARRRARLGLAASLVWNLGLLGYFKYAGFFAASLNGLLGAAGLGAPLPVLAVVLPVGVSYFTLIKLGVVIDVYLGRQAPCEGLLTWATFVAFFPQIVAGPVVRGPDLLPQYARVRRLDPAALRAGALIFLVGYARKAWLADFLALNVVNPTFADPAHYSALGHWLALVAFAVQIYCDFAGYSEMAIGCAALFGVRLPENFKQPFLSRSLFELWRRWHITLNAWLFDYVYGLLSTSRGRLRGRLDVGLMVVFLASGLWHGAAWGFVIWGALHGVGLVVNRRWDVFYRGLCKKDRIWVGRRRTRAYALLGWALTQGFFVITLLPFRLPDWRALVVFAGGLWRGAGPAWVEVPSLTTVFGLVVVAGFLAVEHLLALSVGARRLRDGLLRAPAPIRGVIYGLAVVALAIFMPPAGGAFIYARF